MPTLWVLGSSFAVAHRSDDNYIYMVAEGLGLELAGYALGGSSIPYMCIQQWPKIRDRIGNGDIVLVALATPQRTYFISEYPTISSLSDISPSATQSMRRKSDNISKEEKSAIFDYYLYLHSDLLNLSWLQSWFYELNHVCIERGAAAVVLDGKASDADGDKFGNTTDIDSSACRSIIRGYGHLYDISQAEAVDTASAQWLIEHDDFRMNHIGIQNHKVLANKIISSVRDGVQLDLTTGFYTKYIDQKYFKSVDWLQQHTTWPPYCNIEGVWP